MSIDLRVPARGQSSGEPGRGHKLAATLPEHALRSGGADLPAGPAAAAIAEVLRRISRPDHVRHRRLRRAGTRALRAIFSLLRDAWRILRLFEFAHSDARAMEDLRHRITGFDSEEGVSQQRCAPAGIDGDLRRNRL